MSHEKLRREILYEAARLLHFGKEADCGKARIAAARRVCRGWVKPADLPSDREIHDEVDRFRQQAEPNHSDNRFALYRRLLLPLAQVGQSRARHPEGDVLYHSLQVYDLAHGQRPWDEEFLLAALLHDVGKGIDPLDHVPAGLAALGESITDRTAWLIELHPDALAWFSGTLGARARRRLERSEHVEDVKLLAECDRAGRVPGVAVPQLDDALEYLIELAEFNGD